MATMDDVAKLPELQAQLAQVEAILATAPADPELLKLKADLAQLISITKELNPAKPAARPAAAATSTTAAASTVQPMMMDEHKWKKGDRVRAPFEDGKSYAARIESVADSTCLVTFLRHGDTAEVPLKTLQPYLPADPQALDKGTTVWAIWPQDGLFYEAVIDGILPNKQYRVKFDSYDGEKITLPLYDIRSRKPREQSKELSDKAIIPENLRILPTDTDKVKETKRKKIKRIKSTHRQKVREEESNKRKNNWQEFMKAGFKRQKRSIFASPDSVDGRVGVTGSGKGMTKFEDRSKHAFMVEDPTANKHLQPSMLFEDADEEA